jgi:hypothetical protein
MPSIDTEQLRAAEQDKEDQLLAAQKRAAADRDKSWSSTAAGLYDDKYISDDPLLVGAAWGDNSASRTQGRIVRAEWDDYVSRFFPKEDELFGGLGRPANTEQAMARTDAAFDNAKAAAGRRQALYGAPQSPEAMAANDRTMQLSRQASKAGAANRANARKQQRDMGIMGGSMNSVANYRED